MAKRPDILVLSEDADEYQPQLGDLDARICTAKSSEQACRVYDGQAIVLGQPDLVATVLPRMEGVRWVQSTWAGITPLLQAPRDDYVLTGVKDVFGPQMAEYVFGHLLSQAQRIPDHAEQQAQRNWRAVPSRPLHGRRLGIMGTGSIGRHIAQVAAAFGMKVSGLNRSGAAVVGFAEIFSTDRLEAFLPSLDYLVAVLPDTEATTGLLDAAAFRRMKPEAVLVNIGRGNLVDESALCAALEAGALGAAVLDVFRNEPLPADSPLWNAPRLIITPHIAAQSWPRDIAAIFRENYQRYMAGQPLLYTIDFSQGY